MARELYIQDTGATTREYPADDLLMHVADSIRWDDLRFPFSLQRQGATGKPDFDYTNMGLLFPQNDATEIVYIIGQMPHDWKIGSSIHPHIHWVQDSSDIPGFEVAYRIYENGTDPTGGFTTLTTLTEMHTYASGSILQVSKWPLIDMSSITEISALVEFKVYRDDNVISGDVLGKEFDIHYQKDSLGAYTEEEKTRV